MRQSILCHSISRAAPWNEHFVLDPSNDHTAKSNTGVQDLGGRRCLPEGDQGDSLPGC